MCDNIVSSYLLCLPCSMLNIFKAKNYSIFHKTKCGWGGNGLFLAKGSFLTFFFSPLLTKDFNFEISGVLIFLTSFPMGNQWIP